MLFVITYRSYMEFKDREVYNNKADAEKRFQQLAKCAVVDQLEMNAK